MSRTLLQPIGQKRLTNIAVVRLKKHGNRFEIACYKNKVLSWRSAFEKDIDEVLQSHTVYSNVSKGVLAKSKDLIAAFGMDDQTKICLEILEKGQLQVAGKEREAQLSSQFRDIATIVMQKTINPETKHPYTISMVERLMHEIHFAVDPNSSSKKQALEVIRQLLQKFPIKRSQMRLRITVSPQSLPYILEKLETWSGEIVSKEESASQLVLVCELDPGLFRDFDGLVRILLGKLEILAVHAEVGVDHFDEFHEDIPQNLPKDSMDSERLQNRPLPTSGTKGYEGDVKQSKCNTCNALVGDSKQYREHFKSDWHKHNLKRKTRNLPSLSFEESVVDTELSNSNVDLKEYSF